MKEEPKKIIAHILISLIQDWKPRKSINKRLLEQLFAETNFIVSRWRYYNPNLISDCLRGYSKQSDLKEEV